MTQLKIRPIALCILRHSDRILVFEGYDSTKRQTFYRPLGGGIEFGETGAEAVVREMREEIKAEITDVKFMGSLENIFTGEGKLGHEIVLIYAARFVDETLYDRQNFDGAEDDGTAIRVLWQRLATFGSSCHLYPDGLLKLLKETSSHLQR